MLKFLVLFMFQKDTKLKILILYTVARGRIELPTPCFSDMG